MGGREPLPDSSEQFGRQCAKGFEEFWFKTGMAESELDVLDVVTRVLRAGVLRDNQVLGELSSCNTCDRKAFQLW